MHVKLTKSYIEKIPFPEKVIFYRDTELTGFAVKANPTKLVYIVEAKVNGRVVRKNIAAVTKLTPEEARKEAKKLLGKMAGGRDINLEAKKERSKNITLQQAYEDYINIKSIAEGTKIKYERSMRLSFDDWRNRKITTINRDMVERRFKERSAHSQAIANSDFRFLRALLNFAMEQYIFDSEPLIPSNPCNRLKALRLWNRIERKNSYIHPSKLKAVFNVLKSDDEDSKYINTVKNQCLFILFTGCRDQEAGCLQWNDINLDLKTATFNKTKNHKTHILPLGDYLSDYLQELKRNTDSPYVFPAKNKSGHLENHRKAVQMISELSGVQFSLHDLRRTFASIANNHIPGITNFTLKKLLNHSESDITAGYIQFEVESLRRPMQLIEDYILIQAGVKESANKKVIEFNRKGA